MQLCCVTWCHTGHPYHRQIDRRFPRSRILIAHDRKQRLQPLGGLDWPSAVRPEPTLGYCQTRAAMRRLTAVQPKIKFNVSFPI
jgi:hypothetical protein